jgi:hypothetical protein
MGILDAFSMNTVYASLAVAFVMGGVMEVTDSQCDSGNHRWFGLPFAYALAFFVGWFAMITLGDDCDKLKADTSDSDKADSDKSTYEKTFDAFSVSDLLGTGIMFVVCLVGVVLGMVPIPGVKTIISGVFLNNSLGYAFVVFLVSYICYTIMRGVKC